MPCILIVEDDTGINSFRVLKMEEMPLAVHEPFFYRRQNKVKIGHFRGHVPRK